MTSYQNTEFGGERPLFNTHDIELENVTIHAGESAIKCSSGITARHCRFEGKYPFWHCCHFTVEDTEFTVGARAALWYSDDCRLERCVVDAPKMFREMRGITLRDVTFSDAQETLWHCGDIDIRDVRFTGADYLFMHCENIRCADYHQDGNYSYQYTRNVEIRDSVINSKDAFWNSENVTVYDSELNGEYLGWHSRGLRLVRCHISGTQPLCYTHGLILEDCTFAPDCDLAFEDAEVEANILSHVTSVKNPYKGHITAQSYGEIIIDENRKAGAECVIKTP